MTPAEAVVRLNAGAVRWSLLPERWGDDVRFSVAVTVKRQGRRSQETLHTSTHSDPRHALVDAVKLLPEIIDGGTFIVRGRGKAMGRALAERRLAERLRLDRQQASGVDDDGALLVPLSNAALGLAMYVGSFTGETTEAVCDRVGNG